MNESSKRKSQSLHEVLEDSALVGAQKRKPLKCWTCDEVGHIQRFCPKRKEKLQHLTGKLYHLKCEVIADKESASIVSEDLPEGDLWHQRLGHVNRQQLNTLVDRDLASGIKLSPTSKLLSFCEGCIEGKVQRKGN